METHVIGQSKRHLNAVAITDSRVMAVAASQLNGPIWDGEIVIFHGFDSTTAASPATPSTTPSTNTGSKKKNKSKATADNSPSTTNNTESTNTDSTATATTTNFTHWAPHARIPMSCGVSSVAFVNQQPHHSLLIAGCDNGTVHLFEILANTNTNNNDNDNNNNSKSSSSKAGSTTHRGGTLGHEAHINALGVWGETNSFVSASEDSTVVVWDVGANGLTQSGKIQVGVAVTDVSCDFHSQDILASASAYPGGGVFVWDKRQPQSHTHHVTKQNDCLTLVFSPTTQNAIVTGHEDGFVKVWDLRSLSTAVSSWRVNGAVTNLSIAKTNTNSKPTKAKPTTPTTTKEIDEVVCGGTQEGGCFVRGLSSLLFTSLPPVLGEVHDDLVSGTCVVPKPNNKHFVEVVSVSLDHSLKAHLLPYSSL